LKRAKKLTQAFQFPNIEPNAPLEQDKEPDPDSKDWDAETDLDEEGDNFMWKEVQNTYFKTANKRGARSGSEHYLSILGNDSASISMMMFVQKAMRFIDMIVTPIEVSDRLVHSRVQV
jgi:hypothetical protein